MATQAKVFVEVVHRVPGRIRFRIPSLRSHPELADRLIAAGMAHPGVRQVRVNLACGSVVVEGETREDVDADQLRLIRRWLITPTDGQRQSPTSPSPLQRMLPLGLSLGGVAVTFLGGWWTGVALALTVAG